jgi:hypothetical protein
LTSLLPAPCVLRFGEQEEAWRFGRHKSSLPVVTVRELRRPTSAGLPVRKEVVCDTPLARLHRRTQRSSFRLARHLG